MMIGRLRGILAEKGMETVIIDVNGVGYEVTISERLRMELPSVGEVVSLHTDLLVREDILRLFGFGSSTEREWYRLLTSVQGIGAKAALAILGALGSDGVGRAIALGDWNAVAKAKGVGPKTAQRVVNELKDKAPSLMALVADEPLVETDVPSADQTTEAKTPAKKPRRAAKAPDENRTMQPEALSALGNLGYGPSDAAQAVAQAMSDDPAMKSTSDLIRAALKLLAPKG